MRTNSALLIGLSWLLLGALADAAQAPAEFSLNEHDRVLVLAPHPDDEVLGCGGVIQQALARNLPVRIVFLTYGDHNEWSFMIYRKHPVLTAGSARRMGLIRHDEALAAAKVLGVPPDRLSYLGYPDLGTIHIWSSHWNQQPPFRSRLTGATAVPYANAFQPGAPYRGEEIVRDLTAVIRDFQPTKIFISHPADHHPDHRALYLFGTVALWNLEPELKPEVCPYLVHFKAWPQPKGLHPANPLDAPGPLRDQIRWRTDPLTLDMTQRNRQALREHRTQYDYSSRRLLALIRTNELFGDFPSVMLRAGMSAAARLTSEPGGQLPEALTEEENATLLEVEDCRAALDHQDLVLTIEHSRRLSSEAELSLFVFGYRPDRDFGDMPKLHLKAGAVSVETYDGTRRVAPTGVGVQRGSRRITFRIPLAAMENPDRILVTARTYVGDLPVDWTSWRILELQPATARNRWPETDTR